jgi:hypothetical protein
VEGAVILPELRALAWSQVVGPVAVGAALLTLTSAGALGGPQPDLVWLGLGALATAGGACLDDPAANITEACPMGRRHRSFERLVVPVVIAAGWCAFTAGLDGVHGFSGPSLARTGVGLMLSAVAASDLLRRNGIDQPGAIVGSATLGLVLGCLFFQPFGDLLVLQGYAERGSFPGLWTVASLLAVVSFACTSADPARRRHRA